MSSSNNVKETEPAIQIILAGENPNEFNKYDYKTALAKALEEHSRNTGIRSQNSKMYECNICDYKYKKKFNFEEHMREHTGEIPYSCDICGYKSIHKRCHRVHQLTHMGEKQYKCRLCPYKTIELACYEKHLTRHKSGKPQIQHICNECDFTTETSKTLRFHILRNHTLGRVYECRFCEFIAPRPYQLRRHMQTHINVTLKEKLCRYCDKKLNLQ